MTAPDEIEPIRFEVVCELEAGMVRVHVVGELDLAARYVLPTAVRNALERHAVPSVHIDLSGLTFMDSTGLHDLISAGQIAAAHDAVLIVQGARPNVRRVVQLANLDHLLDQFG